MISWNPSMRRRLPDDIISVTMTNNETWNDCPSCGKAWKDKIATPGLIHRTRYCDDCKPKMYEEVYGHMRDQAMTMTPREMKEIAGECCQDNCNEIATHNVYWPGQGKKIMCEEHSKKAVAVAMAMGFTLHVESIA